MDRDRGDRAGEAGSDSPNCAATRRHIAEAPVFLAWCADLARLDRACELRGYTQVTDYVENFLVAAADAAIASQNGALAAESLGLGICYIGAIRNRPAEVIELLEMPRLTFPIAGMTARLARRQTRPSARGSTPRRCCTGSTTTRREQDRLLHAYDEAMIATGIYQGRQVPAPGERGEMEDYGWLEHSARRVSQPTRTGLREVLEKQGFPAENSRHPHTQASERRVSVWRNRLTTSSS